MKKKWIRYILHCFLIIDLIAEKGTILYNDQIWDKVKNEFRDYEFEDKSYSYYSEDYDLISKTKITNIYETKFREHNTKIEKEEED